MRLGFELETYHKGGRFVLFTTAIEGSQCGRLIVTPSLPLQGMEQPDHVQASRAVDPASTPSEPSVSKNATSSC